MKDIKTLYLDAKARGTPSTVAAYSEAVQELLENNPLQYYTQAEYIISSSVGVPTLKKFVEKWGLPIPAYDHVMEMLEGCVSRAEEQKQDTAPFQEAIKYLEEFRAKYPHCFAMFETVRYMPNNPVSGEVENVLDEYVEKYYSSDHNSKHVQGRKLPSMASDKSYGEMAIPDVMITANTIGSDALKAVFEYFKTSDQFVRSAKRNQLIYECSKDMEIDQTVSEYVESLKTDAIETAVHAANQRNANVFREAAIVGSDDARIVFTEQELLAIQELITIKEAVVTEGGSDAIKAYNEVMKLYESLDGFVDEAGNVVAEDVSDSVIPNLPMATGEAAPWMMNTMNKKTGAMPLYISRNHDLGYGEDPSFGKSSDGDDHDTTLADFKRKDTSMDNDDDDDVIEPADDSSSSQSTTPAATEPSGNNYYYYTYNNSLNQNRDSFNKDSSVHDDHSKKFDDHSTGKHTQSDNVTGPTKDDEDEADYQALESAEDFSDFGKPKKDPNEKEKAKELLREMFQFQGKLGDIQLESTWSGRPTVDDMQAISTSLSEAHDIQAEDGNDRFSLDVHSAYNPFMEVGVDSSFMEEFILMCEGAKQDWKKECRMFQQLFNHDLNKLGDINSPPKKITLNIGGKKMSFRTSKGYSQTTGRQMERYAQIPTSIHNFNVNRDDFVEDKIGIAKAVLHQLRMIDASCDRNATISDAVKQYGLSPDRIIFKPCGEIGITFKTNLRQRTIGLNIEPDLTVHDGDEQVAFEAAAIALDPEDNKPQSDHPIRDRLMDFDRETTKVQQAAKKKVQEVQQGARAFAKPVQRSVQWVGKIAHEWRDMDENKVKEKLADPHARNNLFSAIGSAIKYGSLAKAGLLLNPVFLFLTVTKKIGHNKNVTRLRNEVLGELDAEIEIINEKIHQAEQDKKPNEKYKLMRFRKELEKKKLRVGGGKKISRVL